MRKLVIDGIIEENIRKIIIDGITETIACTNAALMENNMRKIMIDGITEKILKDKILENNRMYEC